MRSRYSETDKMGYVYYARYLEYFEVARTEMIRSIGISYRQLEEEAGVMLPVVESHIEYKSPLFYDDQIFIHVYMFEVPSVKLKTYYEMYSTRSDQLHASGKVTLCFMDEKNRRPCRAPQLFSDKFTAALNTER
jgi:acyl-CoA thioester hydrolase